MRKHDGRPEHKTGRHAGGGVPIFAGLRPPLQDVFDHATPGERLAITRWRTGAVNLRTGFERTVILGSQVDLKAGTYVGRRPKSGVSRAAVLWPEVVAALKKIPKRKGVDAIFNTSTRSHTILSVLRAWRRYRKAAGDGEDLS